MGVPTFYRWLTQKYPKIVLPCLEEFSDYDKTTGDFVPVNITEPNPSSVEFDNLYLDMNGIIHPCSHPETISEQPETEEEMFLNVMTYIDRLMNCVRPRKLLYMAIDGVAPRAKMNQQRLRRFKAAAGSREKKEKYEKLKAQFELEGREVPPYHDKWDYNVITPGSQFMDRLAHALRFFVKERMTNDPGWKDLTVIFSDASMPGEGEHKIMQYIRDQRCSSNYDWNMTHCIYGMDADLIMLGLGTHEARFYVIREEVVFEQKDNEPQTRRCGICGAQGHWASDCTGESIDNEERKLELMGRGIIIDDSSEVPPSKAVEEEVTGSMPVNYENTSKSSRMFRSSWTKFQFLSIPILREYLANEFSFDGTRLMNKSFVDFERCIDDFLLMCFFVGNDFLPHLPALSIQKGSIDQMILLYQKLLPQMGDYLTDNGRINYKVLAYFCKYLALSESEILKNEWKKMDMKKNREKNNKDRVDDIRNKRKADLKKKGKTNEMEEAGARSLTLDEQHEYFSVNLKKKTREDNDAEDNVSKSTGRDVVLGSEPMEIYRPRYYRAKLKLPPTALDNENNDPEVEDAALSTARAYVTGLSWVLQYYLQGTLNWEWFYPFHYAPFTVDILKYGLTCSDDVLECSYVLKDDDYNPNNIVKALINAKSEPFTPFEQLMAVLPVASKHALPKPYQSVMSSIVGPISDVYPISFKEDPDGKRQNWLWIPLLPFVDHERLKNIGMKVLMDCSLEEQGRNKPGSDWIYRYNINGDSNPVISSVSEEAYSRYSCYPWPRSLNHGAKCTEFEYQNPPRQFHRCTLGRGVIRPDPVLTPEDFEVDENDRAKKNAFNAAVARRIIMTTLAKKGIVSAAEADRYQDPRFQNRNQSGYNAQVSKHGNIRHQDYGNVALGAVQNPWHDSRGRDR